MTESERQELTALRHDFVRLGQIDMAALVRLDAFLGIDTYGEGVSDGECQ